MRELSLLEMRTVAGGQEKTKPPEKFDPNKDVGPVQKPLPPRENKFELPTAEEIFLPERFSFGSRTFKNEPLPGQENLSGLLEDTQCAFCVSFDMQFMGGIDKKKKDTNKNKNK